MKHQCGLDFVLEGRGPSGWSHPYLPLGESFDLPCPLLPPCPQVCFYLVAEISDLQGVGLAAVGEVQAVVTFGGEQAVLEALLVDMTGEGLLQRLLST